MTSQFSLVKAEAFNALNNRLTPDLETLLASTETFLDGDVITTFSGGHCYQVVASGEDLTTAGGAKLKVLPGAGRVLTPEQFGADGSGSTICTAEFQAFLDAVVASKGRGIAAGRYRIDDTVFVNNPFVDSVTDDSGDASAFYLSVGTGESQATGLYYVGGGGTGDAPDEVKPAIAFHNVNFFNLGNICVTNKLDEEERYTCGIRWTGSADTQRGNATVDLFFVRGFERGIVIGMHEKFPDSNMDIFEKVNIHKIHAAHCRYPLYISCKTSDGWTIGHLLSTAYNTSGNGPMFHRLDPDNTASEVIIHLETTGYGTIKSMELAQHDMVADGSGTAVQFDTVHVLGGSLELSNCYSFLQKNASSSRNPTVIHDVRTNVDCFGENGRAAWFLGNARLVNCSFAGRIRCYKPLDLVNPAFFSDTDPSMLDVESSFFNPYGDLSFDQLSILNLRCHDSGSSLWSDFSFSQIPNLATKLPQSQANMSVANATTEVAEISNVLEGETVELSFFAELGGVPVETGRMLLTRVDATNAWGVVNPLTDNSEIDLLIDSSDAANGNFSISVTNLTGSGIDFVVFELFRGQRA